MTSSATPARNFPRVFVAGTDTGVGKTEVCCALIRAARRRNLRALPFKPAQSGDERPTDAERLARAAQHPSLSVDDIAPLRYDRNGCMHPPNIFRPGLPAHQHGSFIPCGTGLRIRGSKYNFTCCSTRAGRNSF